MVAKETAWWWEMNFFWRDLRELSLLRRKQILRSVIPRKSACVGYVSYVDGQAMKLFEMIKKGDLEGLVVNRKDGKYSQRTLWYKILNPVYTHRNRPPGIFPKTVKIGGGASRTPPCGTLARCSLARCSLPSLSELSPKGPERTPSSSFLTVRVTLPPAGRLHGAT
jgi:hypothetical protein